MESAQIAVQKRGLDYFRRVVALIYREIGVLRLRHHRLIASKAKLVGELFGPDRKVQAKRLYKLSLTDTSITQTLGRYEQRTGLTLQDVYEASRDWNWSCASGNVSFGERRWAAITKAGIELAAAIQSNDWLAVGRLADLVDKLEHNSGRITGKFTQLD